MKGFKLPTAVEALLTEVADGGIAHVKCGSPAHRAALSLQSNACGNLLVVGPAQRSAANVPPVRPVCLRIVYEARHAEGLMGVQG